MTTQEIRDRLEALRAEIRAERISYGEIAELRGLAEHIDPGDIELLQWAGVPEGTAPDTAQSQAVDADFAHKVRQAFECVQAAVNAKDQAAIDHWMLYLDDLTVELEGRTDGT